MRRRVALRPSAPEGVPAGTIRQSDQCRRCVVLLVVQDEDVDQTANFRDAQPDGVRLSVVFDGVGGVDREGGQGQGGEAVPGPPAADLVLVETDDPPSGAISRRRSPEVSVSHRRRTPLISPPRAVGSVTRSGSPQRRGGSQVEPSTVAARSSFR
jgi:hypothetical protein